MGFGLGGDIRLDQRRDWLVGRVVETGSVVMKQVGGDRAGEIAGHRFVSHEDVTPEAILGDYYASTAAACAGADVLAIQDTSEINFSGRALGRKGLGPGGDGKTASFFIHPVLAVDAASGAMLGLAHARIWTRGPRKAANRKARAFADKEAVRWRDGMIAAAGLGQARRITVVGDRESDIYPLFAARPEGVDLLVRAAQNRCMAGGGLLFEAAAAFEPRLCASIDHRPRAPGEKPRKLKLHVSAGRVAIACPGKAGTGEIKSIDLNLVVAEEKGGGVIWRLLTTLPIDRPEDILDIIARYKLRWRIEETFRALKRGGLGLEDTQIETAHRLFNLAAIALTAAVRIIQLTDARDASSRPASDVIADQDMAAALAIGRSLERKTVKQRNPHPETSLAHIAWIVARLGGWNCYGKPPGPKTMAHGWQRLALMLQAVTIAKAEALV
jgi:Transposase DDE domain